MAPRKVLVSADLVALLEEMANDILTDDEQSRDWRDENQTSAISRTKGGVLRLDTDHDWKVAFAIWYFAPRSISAKLPRER